MESMPNQRELHKLHAGVQEPGRQRSHVSLSLALKIAETTQGCSMSPSSWDLLCLKLT